MRYLALDIGNVICDVAQQPFLEILSENFNITIAEAQRFLKRFQRLHDLGHTTMEDELKDKFSVKSPAIIKKLVNAWNDSMTPNLPIMDTLNRLRKEHSVQIALLSNIGVEHAAMMEETLKHDGFFPNAIKHFSCDVGARKPSMIFYQSFLLQYPQFKGCLYVDDLQENLDSSDIFGFTTLRLALDEPGYDLKIKDIERLIVGAD